MKTIMLQTKDKTSFDKVNTILFIVYCYIRLSINNDKQLDVDYSKLNKVFSDSYNELFNEYRLRVLNVKETLKQTLLMNSTMFELKEKELISLVEIVHFFYQTEYTSDLHGIINLSKVDIDKAVINLLEVMISFGNISFDYGCPLQLRQNNVLNKYIL
jgi:hypothetical protein